MNIQKKYSYDDLLLKPQRSPVDSRDHVSLETNVTPNNKLDSPLISAPMDSVTGAKLAQEMTDNGGVGIIHRFSTIENRKEMVEKVNGLVGASVGLSDEEFDYAFELQHSGADFICLDVAHGHMEKCLERTESLSEHLDVDLMVGNVASKHGMNDLLDAGADSVKLGVGPGSACTTREKTGHGVPQASAVDDCYFPTNDEDYTLIADGGIKKPGDAVKALMLGADAVMMGGVFGRCYESPAGGDVWGCASSNGEAEEYIEGEVRKSEEKYHVSDVFEEFEQGIRSGLSYSGGHTIDEARSNAKFQEVTYSTQERNGGFSV
jgi:IMP dehydrogenase